jgi:predicted CXXCH cytochrome family protein
VRLVEWADPGGVTRTVVGCTTCHNPHRRGGYPYLLNISNSASALCLTCHIK